MFIQSVPLLSLPSSALQIFPLISQSRWLVKSGELAALESSVSPGLRRKLNTRPVHLHLFNDCLLLSRPRESVIGMGGQSTKGKWEKQEGRTERDRERSCSKKNPSQWPNSWSPGHGIEKKEKDPKQKRESHQICHKITWQDLYHIINRKMQ